VTISRPEEDGELGAIEVRNPPGLLGLISKVTICPAAQAEHGDCPADSQIGGATVGLGAGLFPLYTAGAVYLTSPYQGAPFGLAVAVPLRAGPFDLGELTVRAKLEVNPETAAISISSDPLPQSLDGIPLQIRTIHLDLDRQGFIVNPTSCRRLAAAATIIGPAGEAVQAQSPFQARDCGRLSFRPKLALKLAGEPGRGGHPKLRAVLAMPKGEANLRRATITLPPSELLDSAHLKAPCTTVQLQTASCPPGSVIGHAEVKTPVLKKPLTGPVYLRSSGHGLPDLLIALKGELPVDIKGRIESAKGALRARFPALPDVPFSRFLLSFRSGGRGLLVNSENLCNGRSQASVRLEGQNGARLAENLPLRRRCPRH
jgi:hypothetical protein